MHPISLFLRALGRFDTYDLRRNAFTWFGFVWGLPIPVFSFSLDHVLLHEWAQRSLLTILVEHPWQLFFLAHPPAFAVVFGALGTLFKDLESHNRELIGRLEREATTDSLTGACTRRFVLSELEGSLARSGRSAEPVSVILMDMDNFKHVNDTQGHLAGDELLRNVAEALRDSLRRGDTLGRYGGDEFLIVAPGGDEGALAVAERAREAVRKRTGHSISYGIAVSDGARRSIRDLITAADEQLAFRKREHTTRRFGPPTVRPAM